MSMHQDAFSPQVLVALCKNGDIESVRTFLEKTLPSLPQERRATFCHHLHPAHDVETLGGVPCIAYVVQLSGAAAEGAQTSIFTYLWDTFLAPRGITAISWPCLKAAAYQGTIPLAQAFHSRDPKCFNRIEESQTVHPEGIKRTSQIEIAIRNDRFEYLDFILAHGADINVKLPGKDLFRMVVRCAVDDTTTLQRLRFLGSRGASAAGSVALREVVLADDVELAACLLDCGTGVDDAVDPERSSPLILAASLGQRDMVQLLLDRGANARLADGEGQNAEAIARRNGHDGIIRLLHAHQLS